MNGSIAPRTSRPSIRAVGRDHGTAGRPDGRRASGDRTRRGHVQGIHGLRLRDRPGTVAPDARPSCAGRRDARAPLRRPRRARDGDQQPGRLGTDETGRSRAIETSERGGRREPRKPFAGHSTTTFPCTSSISRVRARFARQLTGRRPAPGSSWRRAPISLLSVSIDMKARTRTPSVTSYHRRSGPNSTDRCCGEA